MTTNPPGLWDDQHIEDYLKLELEFANEFAAKIVHVHNDWQSYQNFWSPVRRFLGVFFAAIAEWKEMISPSSPERQTEEGYEEAIDDPKDSTYQENWTPTSLYRWAYLTLKFKPIDSEDDERLEQLAVRMFRTQHYDFELFGSSYELAYPLAEDLVSRSPSPVLEDQQRAGPTLIHRLPPEILSEVLVRAHGGVLYWPIIISHVDSRFRTIADSTALLWTRIDVNLPLPLVKLYLKRSSTALLDIRIDLGSGGRRQHAVSRLGAFLAEVAEHRERIASLSMSAFKPQVVDEMVKLMIGPGFTFPQLRRLETGCPVWVSGSWPRTLLEPLDCPVVAPPQLQELCLRGLRSRNWVTAFPEPMAGLRSLCLANDTKLFLLDLLIVLTKLPNLETLVVQDCTIQQDPLAAPSALTLPNLTTLQYVSLSDRSMTSLHPVLLTPKLTSLRMWWDSGFRSWLDQVSPLVAILRMNPQLENLDLCNCVLQSSGWRDAFSKAGSLRYLRLRSCELVSNDLDALSELGVGEDGEQRLLPLLNHLILENAVELSLGDIKRIVAHRPGLQCLELRGWDGTNVEEQDVKFMRQSVECFLLETYCKGLGVLEDEGGEDNEEWSGSGTPSEASWVSGDQDVVSGHLAAANSGGG
ncbi:hypothetical protein FS837_010481 [Tulasnella sp. UAMH 9824]|nr:hypothetical protein FS837_010481 [Tulasnella sp. UAMH 9824]